MVYRLFYTGERFRQIGYGSHRLESYTGPYLLDVKDSSQLFESGIADPVAEAVHRSVYVLRSSVYGKH